jgi:hypothetical protein
MVGCICVEIICGLAGISSLCESDNRLIYERVVFPQKDSYGITFDGKIAGTNEEKLYIYKVKVSQNNCEYNYVL